MSHTSTTDMSLVLRGGRNCASEMLGRLHHIIFSSAATSKQICNYCWLSLHAFLVELDPKESLNHHENNYPHGHRHLTEVGTSTSFINTEGDIQLGIP